MKGQKFSQRLWTTWNIVSCQSISKLVQARDKYCSDGYHKRRMGREELYIEGLRFPSLWIGWLLGGSSKVKIRVKVHTKPIDQNHFFKNSVITLCFMYGCFACIHFCASCEPDPLKLELQTAMSCNVGAGNEPGSYGRAASALNCQASSPASANHFRKHYSTVIVRYGDTRKINQAWWHWPVIPVVGKAKHENYSSSLGYKARLWYKEKKMSLNKYESF